MTAAVLYFIKKKKFVDEESDTLFVKQKDTKSWMEFLDPRNRREPDDGNDEFDRL